MAQKRADYVTALDVGTTLIKTMIADLAPDGRLRVLGVGVSESRGVKRGVIDDMAEVTAAIRTSVERAEAASGGIKVTSAYVGLAGAHVSAMNNKGLTAIGNPQRPITEADVDRAIDSARTLAIPSNREVVHVLPRHFLVDNSEQVTNPVGMHGQRLDVDAHVVTGAVGAMQNLKRCVMAAGVGVELLVLEQLASADAVLDDDERRHGVILADIGGGTTDIVIYLNGAVYHTSVIPLGGDSVTNDLVHGIRAPFSAAMLAKETYGHAIPSMVGADETVEVEAFGADPQRIVSRRRISEIIQARMEEILELIGQDVHRTGLDELAVAGLVLTGGGANLEGVDQLAADVLRVPVRLAYPHEVTGKTEIIVNPAFSTSIGLLDWAVRDRRLRPGVAAQPVVVQRPMELSGWVRKLQAAVRVMLP